MIIRCSQSSRGNIESNVPPMIFEWSKLKPDFVNYLEIMWSVSYVSFHWARGSSGLIFIIDSLIFSFLA
jgi:hypothetical protein